MQVTLHYDPAGIKHISVIGELESRTSIEHLLYEITSPPEDCIHITFFDANIIDCKIIDQLHKLQQEKEVKIFVLRPFLYSYLYRLGISCKYIPKKSIKSLGIEEEIDSKTPLDREKVMLFLRELRDRYGYDYTHYQLDSILRRIHICMLRVGFKSFKEFRISILENEQLFDQLFQDFSINITSFFRDPHVFREIRDNILPYLNSYAHIKIWCAGCSTGQEPYSIAILLDELGILHKTQIYATDINPYVIEEAKNGLYTTANIDEHIGNYRSAHGARSFVDYFHLKGNYMEVQSKIKERILFFQHSLVGSGTLNEFQLILCRNVLIYFDSNLQKKLLENFCNSLDRSGFLILGKSEGILHNGGDHFFKSWDPVNRIYKRRSYIPHNKK